MSVLQVESLSVQVTSSKDRVDALFKKGLCLETCFTKVASGAPCKSEDDQSLRPRRSLCGLQTMLRASTAVVDNVDCDSSEPPMLQYCNVSHAKVSSPRI